MRTLICNSGSTDGTHYSSKFHPTCPLRMLFLKSWSLKSPRLPSILDSLNQLLTFENLEAEKLESLKQTLFLVTWLPAALRSIRLSDRLRNKGNQSEFLWVFRPKRWSFFWAHQYNGRGHRIHDFMRYEKRITWFRFRMPKTKIAHSALGNHRLITHYLISLRCYVSHPQPSHLQTSIAAPHRSPYPSLACLSRITSNGRRKRKR